MKHHRDAEKRLEVLWPSGSENNRIEAALQQAAGRVSASLFGLVSDEVFEAVQRDILDDPAVAAALGRSGSGGGRG